MELKDRIREAMAYKGLKATDLAKATRKTAGAVSQWLDGSTKSLRGETAALIEAATGYRSSWLATGKGPKFVAQSDSGNFQSNTIGLKSNATYSIARMADIKSSSGGQGYAVEFQEEQNSNPVVFHTTWFETRGLRPEYLLALKVTGLGMEPTLFAGDIVVVNTADTEPVDGVVFMTMYDGVVAVKRLVRDSGAWWLESDNADKRAYPRKACTSETTRVIGRVVYKQSEHI